MANGERAKIENDGSTTEAVQALVNQVTSFTPGHNCIDERKDALPLTFTPRNYSREHRSERFMIQSFAKQSQQSVERVAKDHGNAQIAGGDEGFAMIVVAATDLDPELAVAYISEWNIQNGRPSFTVHTAKHEDEHHPYNAEEAASKLDCGHIAAGLSDPKAYGLSEKKMKRIVQATTRLSNARVLTYLDTHKAIAAVYNDSTEITFVPRDGVREVFRVDAGKIEQEIDNSQNGLATFLQSKGVQVTADALKRTFREHTQVSLRKLTEKNPLPVFRSNIQNGTVRLNPQGRTV